MPGACKGCSFCPATGDADRTHLSCFSVWVPTCKGSPGTLRDMWFYLRKGTLGEVPVDCRISRSRSPGHREWRERVEDERRLGGEERVMCTVESR